MRHTTRATIATGVLALGLMALATGCGGGGGGGGTPPTADAGTDQSVVEDTPVALSGTATAGSSAVASVAWTQTSGPAVALSGASTDTPSFTAPKAPIQGTVSLAFLYTVTDANGQTGSDSVSVVVSSDDFVIFTAIKDSVSTAELYKADVETGVVTKLNGPLVAGGSVSFFRMSPDGLTVAYVADQDTDGVQEVYVARTDGSGFVKVSGTMVAGGGAVGSIFWAPDSSRLAYIANQDSPTTAELYTVLPDGTGHAKVNGALIAGGSVLYTGVTPWAPDSSRLAYHADQDTDNVYEVYTSLPDGSGNVKVSGPMAAGGFGAAGVPLWSPDSSRLAYRAAQDSPTLQELYAASPTGGPTVKLNGPVIAGGSVVGTMAWAPDSTRIVYLASQDTSGVQELYSTLTNGSDNTRLNPALPAGRLVLQFAIAPDSSRVAYSADQDTDDVYECYTSLIGGGGNAKVNGALAGTTPSPPYFRWAPDSSRVAYTAPQDSATETEVYTSLPDGTDNVKVSGPLAAGETTQVNSDPATPTGFSPDGSLLSYALFPAAPATDIRAEAALPDGGGSVEYTGVMVAGGTLTQWPLWSPDSSRLVYAAMQDSATMQEIYVASPDGTLNQKISGPMVAGGGATGPYAWSP